MQKKDLIELIIEECNKIINTCNSYTQRENNCLPKKHYTVKILKLQPNKVVINGMIKDRASLSAEEHQAVKTQEEIYRARTEIRRQNEIKQANKDCNNS